MSYGRVGGAPLRSGTAPRARRHHPVLVRPRGVDLQKFYSLSPLPPVDSLRLVCTRSLFPEYRHNVILDAMAVVAHRGVPITLDIVGDGVLLADLENQASALGIADWVRFHGKVLHDRLPQILLHRQAQVVQRLGRSSRSLEELLDTVETVTLQRHQGYTVPRGVMHRTRAPAKTAIVMVEPVGVVPTGD